MNTKKSYAEKLKDPRWQKKRLEILQRDEFTCQLCGDKQNTLHVHHVAYEKGKSPWEYPEYMLETLCEDCHVFAEEIKKLPTYSRFLLTSILNRDNGEMELINLWKKSVRHEISIGHTESDFCGLLDI